MYYVYYPEWKSVCENGLSESGLFNIYYTVTFSL